MVPPGTHSRGATFTCCTQAIFQLTDIWTDTCEVEDYTNMLERILGQVATSAPDGLADAIEEAQAMAGDTSLAASAAIEVHSWPLGHGRWEYDPKVSQRVVDKALELADQVETHGSL